jgi:hypothetical protein
MGDVVNPANPAAELARLQAIVERQQAAGRQLERERAELEREKTLLERRLSEKTLRPPRPPVFKGAMGYEVDTWVRSMVKQFEFDPMMFPPDSHEKRISAATMYLEGAAADWWEHEDKTSINTWQDFVDRLYDRFRPVQAAELARSRLLSLKQRGSVSDYCNRFQKEIAPIKNMQVDEQLFWFKEGLENHIKSEVVKKDPKTLHEAMDAAVKIEAYAGRARGSQYVYRTGPPQSYMRTTSSTTSSGSAPMEISAVRGATDAEEYAGAHEDMVEEQEMPQKHEVSALDHLVRKMENMERLFVASIQTRQTSQFPRRDESRASAAPIPGLRREDIPRLIREGRCFRCKEKGHMKNECPNPRPQLKW